MDVPKCLSLLWSVSEMFVHSHFPALEDFSLVVCNVCNKVVTPQGMLSHYGKTHTHTRTHTYIYSSPTRHHHHTLTRHTHKHSQRLSCLALWQSRPVQTRPIRSILQFPHPALEQTQYNTQQADSSWNSLNNLQNNRPGPALCTHLFFTW